VEVCYAGARKLSGINYTVDQVLEKVLKDRVFYDTTGGGVTLSGGEVLLYYRFASELLCKCKDHRIDTAIETSGYAGWKNFLKVVEYCDLVLYDIKHPDSKKHEEFTGQKNDLILENLGRLYALGKKIIIRIPVIPGFNDSVSTMLDIGAIASGVGVSEIHLLPFHQIGKSKWEALSRPYYYQEAQEQDRAVIQELKNILEKKGFTVSIGGS
jgi:pyruvate formate lyase activating enzyme